MGFGANKRMKLTGAAILVSRGMKVLQAAPAAYPYRSAREGRGQTTVYNFVTASLTLATFGPSPVPS